jgi:regulator of nonsense transcripts 1
LKKKAENEIIKKADVICATCISSADRRLSEYHFNHVLIDEATQAIEP